MKLYHVAVEQENDWYVGRVLECGSVTVVSVPMKNWNYWPASLAAAAAASASAGLICRARR